MLLLLLLLLRVVVVVVVVLCRRLRHGAVGDNAQVRLLGKHCVQQVVAAAAKVLHSMVATDAGGRLVDLCRAEMRLEASWLGRVAEKQTEKIREGGREMIRQRSATTDNETVE